jgi:putative ABC transport system permease protein
MAFMEKTKPQPPRIVQAFLQKVLRDDLAEEVLGDLEEKFLTMAARHSLWRARLNYVYQALHYIRPFAIRKTKSEPLNHIAMFSSYFKIGWRNLSRQKMFSAIMIGGFAIGIAACLLIALYVRQELTHDRHYAHGDRLYRVVRVAEMRGETGKGIHMPAPFADALREHYPEMELVGRCNDVELFGAGSNEVRRADRQESLHEEHLIHADQSLLDILEIPFIDGNPRQALVEPNTVVITSDKAQKYFPGEDAVGKLILLNNDESRPYKITGVIEEFPVTSHFQADFILSLAGREFFEGESTNWGAGNYPTYVRVREGTPIAALEAKLPRLMQPYFVKPSVAEGNPVAIAWAKSLRFELQPIQDIYLNKDGIRDSSAHGDVRYIALFATIAIFILLIACINFINLSTARSANRAKEVGLRKVVGSNRADLIRQFLSESLLFSLFAFVIALLLASLALPYFNTLLGRSLDFPWKEWWLLPAFALAAFATGLLAGVYPSFYLSSFRPAEVLKGKISLGSKRSGMRNLLVVFQFTVSILLVVGTIIVNRQMHYVLTKKTGFDKDHVLLLESTHTLKDRIADFKNELQQISGVSYISVSGYLPVEGAKRNGTDFWRIDDPDKKVNTQVWSVDQDYIRTMGIKIADGRDFSADIASDSLAIIINQTMAKALNFKEPIGQEIGGFMWGNWRIIGVTEDYHFESLRKQIAPICLVLGKNKSTVSIKASTADMPALIAAVTATWKKFSPAQAIRYSFLDQRYARMYEDVARTGRLFTTFAVLAIVIACLGLFALSTFMTGQRSKEISIRLVLGASVSGIFSLITRNFVTLVIIAFVVALPLSIYGMQAWLEEYAYHVEITWDVFALAGFMAVLVTFLTIGYQALKAAHTNPGQNLRGE